MASKQRVDKAVKRPTWMLLLFFLVMVLHLEIDFYVNTGTLYLEWHRLLLFPTLITVYVYMIAYAVEQYKKDPPLLVWERD